MSSCLCQVLAISRAGFAVLGTFLVCWFPFLLQPGGAQQVMPIFWSSFAPCVVAQYSHCALMFTEYALLASSLGVQDGSWVINKSSASILRKCNGLKAQFCSQLKSRIQWWDSDGDIRALDLVPIHTLPGDMRHNFDGEPIVSFLGGWFYFWCVLHYLMRFLRSKCLKGNNCAILCFSAHHFHCNSPETGITINGLWWFHLARASCMFGCGRC